MVGVCSGAESVGCFIIGRKIVEFKAKKMARNVNILIELNWKWMRVQLFGAFSLRSVLYFVNAESWIKL